MKKLSSILAMLAIAVSALLGQNGKITGITYDKATNETLIGATIRVEGTNTGNITDMDGQYALSLEPGKYNLFCSYISFREEKVTDVEIKAGETIKLDFYLESESTQIEAVVITAAAKRNSVTNLMLLQQKSTSMVSGISQEEMRRSPDRNISDVLKRVSGASVQENKFVVIRGLSDRYNIALLNGLSLPSTEPDKRAFSFEIFPSNLLDNLIIYKTATPDLPGEFAGGVIQLNTKEIPEDGFVNFSAGFGYNSQSTMKPYAMTVKGKTDWLGYDDGTRALPAGVNPETLTEKPAETSLLFKNDWNVIEMESMRPSQSYQFSTGRHVNFLKNDLGVVAAVTYNNNYRIQQGYRSDYNVDLSQKFEYQDEIYKENVLTGGLFNLAYKIGNNHKIQFNNILTRSSEDQLIRRTGEQFEETREILAMSSFYQSTKLYSGQLLGEHASGQGKWKAKWGLSYNNIQRDIPSYRRLLYTNNIDDENDLYYAYVPFSSPSPNYAGRFYSSQLEKFYTMSFDISIPYTVAGRRNQVKFGAVRELKDRSFDARVFGYVIPNFLNHDYTIDTSGIATLFAPEHIGPNGFLIKESTDKSDSYTAGSDLQAGYAMAEHFITPSLRLITGVRYERFQQELHSFYIKSTVEANVDTVLADMLPSAHLILALNDKSNLRLSYSKTVTRPNFRELAPFSFYEFLWEAGVNGNPGLQRTRISNYDLRYEIFPGNNQMINISLFYKQFTNPIELVFNNSQGSGTRVFSFENAPAAMDLGAEFEYRLHLGLLADLTNISLFKQVSLSGNFSYIKSSVDLEDIPGALERPLYGQSPYIVNAGLSYNAPENGIGFTVLFNRIGRRIWLVGQDQYLHTYEAPRSVLDFQLTKRILKRGELKLNVGDLLNQEAVFYQDQDNNGRYDATGDTKIAASRFGRNVSLTLGYNF